MTDESRLAVATRAAREGGAVAEAGFRSDLDVEYKDGKNDVVTSSDRAAQRRVISVIEAQFPDDPVVAEEEDAPTAVPDDGPAWIVDPIDGTNNYVRGNRIWSTAVAAVRDGDPVAAAVDHPSIGDIYRAGAASDDGRGDQPGAGAGGGAGAPGEAGDRAGTTRNGEPVTVSSVTDPSTAHVAITMWWELDDRDEYAAVCCEAVERFGDLRRVGSAQATLSLVAGGSLDGAFTTVTAPPWDTVAGVHLIRRAGGRATDVYGDPWTPTDEGLVVSNGTAEIHGELLDAARGAIEG